MEKSKLYKREPVAHFLVKNLEYVPKDLQESLHKVDHAIVEIDDDIVIDGIKNPVIMIIIGFSTRKLVDSLKRKKKRIDNIIIIEPRLDIFKEVLMTEDLSDLLKNDFVDFVVGIPPQELLPHLFKILTKVDKGEYISRVGKILSMERVVDPFSYDNIKVSQEAKEIDAVVTATIKAIELSMGCPDDQHRRWELMIENKQRLFDAWNIKPLFNKFKDVPAIVCGGGPSLEGFIKAYRGSEKLRNGLIIAADAVLHRLLEEGIKPHMVVRCERKRTQIFKGVTKEMTKGIYYCAYPWTPPEFFDLFEDHFALYRNNGVCRFTKLSHGSVDGGVSSGNACLEVAFNLGCKNIIMTGIDLCFIDNQSHVGGTQVEFNINSSKKKWTKIESNDGKQVTTIPVWVRCLNEYYQAIEKWKPKGDFTVYNTSLSGAKVQSTQVKPWSELDMLFDKEHDIDGLIKKHRTKIGNKDIKVFHEEINKALKDLGEIREGCEIALDLEKDAEKTCNGEMEKLIRKVLRETKDDHWGLVHLIRQNQANFDKLTKNIADSYDTNFKQKYIPNKTYQICITDVLQHDVFIYENHVNALFNKTTFQDERFLAYVNLTRDFVDKTLYYCEKFIELFKKA